MRTAIKNLGKIVSAYCLGAESETELCLIQEGKIKRIDEDTYELFSLEAVNGSGEIAHRGDYFKLSSDGYPYPNTREFFEANHRHIEGDRYEQPPKPISAWTADDEMCPEIRFLTETKGLVIDPADEQKYFTAPLWGSLLSAAKDAVVLFYSITRDADGTITDADFNFISKNEFDQTYTWL